MVTAPFGFKLSVDRVLFRKCLAEALAASAKIKMPLTVFYDVTDGGFDYANISQISDNLLPIVEIDASAVKHNLPIDNPKELENIVKSEEEAIIGKMLPELIDRLAPIIAARNTNIF